MYLEAIPRYNCCVTEYHLELNEKECVGVARRDWFWSTQLEIEMDLDEGTTQYSFGQEGWFAQSFALHRVTRSHTKRVGAADSTGTVTTEYELRMPASQRRMTLRYEGYLTTDMELVYRDEVMARVCERGCCCGGWAVGSKKLGLVDMMFVGLVFDSIMEHKRSHNHGSNV